jgi:thiamine kinase-like enzyme
MENQNMKIFLTRYIRYFIKKLMKNNSGDLIFIEDLPKGNWNYNYLVQINNKKFVFRIYSHVKGNFFKNDPLKEYKVLSFLKKYKISQKLIHFDDSMKIIPFTILIYEFLEGERLEYSNGRIMLFAEVLSKLHGASIENLDFLDKNCYTLPGLVSSIENLFSDYKQKKFSDRDLVRSISKFVKKTKKLAKDNENFKQDNCLLHNDLVTGNIIQNKKGIFLIDWQDPVIGDPSYDLWVFLSPMVNLWDNKRAMTNEERTIFLENYIQLSGRKNIKHALKIKTPFYYLVSIIYALNRYCDFKEGKLESSLVKGRERKFEQYLDLAKFGLKRLNFLFKSV